MRLKDVIALKERFKRQLPVARKFFEHMQVNVAILEFPLIDMRLGLFSKIFRQRSGVGIEIYENETAEAFHARFWELVFGAVDVREIPLAGYFLKRSIQVPGPAVETAAELRG